MFSSADSTTSFIGAAADIFLDNVIKDDGICIRFTSDCHPFPSIQVMVLYAPLDSGNDNDIV
jgi:hypothetical protein